MKRTTMNDDQKHLDVTKPGATPVSHTSKPALVNPPQLKRDPMMKQSEAEENSGRVQRKVVNLQPISDNPPEPQSNQQEQPEAVVDKIDEQSSSPAIEDVKTEEAKDNNPEIQALIDKKTYYLPIKKTSKMKLFVIVVVCVVIMCIVTVGLFVASGMN